MGRHQWAAKQAVRLACARMLGECSEKDWDRAQKHLDKRLGELRAATGEKVAKYEIRELFKLGIKRASVKTEEQARAELGDHEHSSLQPEAASAPPGSLSDALGVFTRWLHMEDTGPVLLVAAAVVANLAVGDPVWVLIVGPPSCGKTEILLAISGLSHVVPAATISEAALLSGTGRRERAKSAKGGLLRQVGEFGVLLAKDFTSVLAQNRDTAKQAMAGLREISDGRWDRPVGTDGGKVLHWQGKCGFIGGVTPSYDRYGSIVTALGDRFLLLRMPEVDASWQAKVALAQAKHEKQMRAQLAEAMTGLIASANPEDVHAELSDEETERLVSLASFAARARTCVERDGYTGELLVIPQAEGPARLVKGLRLIYGALGALGVDDGTRWDLMCRIARDCAPAMRVPLMAELLVPTDLLDSGSRRTSDIAEHVGMVT
jgi:energy-coupling factor transporter ATP-binding protein EcfA2